MELTQELVKSLFDYKDGELFYKEYSIGANQKVKKGQKAGKRRPNSKALRYLEVFFMVDGVRFVRHTHRLIFLWHHGYNPKLIDHVDGNGLNNRIENLREATAHQNGANRRSAKGSSSKYLGVWKTKYNTYQSAIRKNGTQMRLGSFSTEEQAAMAYNRAAVKHHGEFAKLNIITL